MTKRILKSLIITTILLTGIAIGSQVHVNQPVTTALSTISINSDETSMLEISNTYRASKDLNKLSINSQLMQSSQMKADDLCMAGNLSHTDSQGRKFYGFVNDAGYDYKHAGENLAKGYANQELAFKALVASPKHLENIVGDYKEIGIGFNECGGKNYLAVHYGTQQ